MKINESTSIITPRILLVPYSAHHVPTYHLWMQDPEIQQATASEPLSLEEEYAMQRSWRADADKLTFIVCTRRGTVDVGGLSIIKAGTLDTPECMVGDVNLFLYDDDEDEDEEEEGSAAQKVTPSTHAPRQVVGELEIMIASKAHQGQGLAQETLRAFLAYIQTRLSGIAAEFAGPRGMVLKYLRVKIAQDNVRSLKLFERIGFVRTSAGANYFGEVEMRTSVVEGRLSDVEEKIGLSGFGSEVGYEIAGDRV